MYHLINNLSGYISGFEFEDELVHDHSFDPATLLSQLYFFRVRSLCQEYACTKPMRYPVMHVLYMAIKSAFSVQI